MKNWIVLGTTCLLAVNCYAQSSAPKTPVEPATICTEPGKVPWNGYDKKMSYSSKPFSHEPAPAAIVPDTTSLKSPESIHSQQWLPEKTRQHDSPCAKAKPPINL